MYLDIRYSMHKINNKYTIKSTTCISKNTVRDKINNLAASPCLLSMFCNIYFIPGKRWPFSVWSDRVKTAKCRCYPLHSV